MYVFVYFYALLLGVLCEKNAVTEQLYLYATYPYKSMCVRLERIKGMKQQNIACYWNMNLYILYVHIIAYSLRWSLQYQNNYF